jgi:hypothetical protein
LTKRKKVRRPGVPSQYYATAYKGNTKRPVTKEMKKGTTKGLPEQVVQKGKKGNELGPVEEEQREEARGWEMEGEGEG